jgi:hypothetical protein
VAQEGEEKAQHGVDVSFALAISGGCSSQTCRPILTPNDPLGILCASRFDFLHAWTATDQKSSFVL